MKARNSEKSTISPKSSVTLEKRSDLPKETESEYQTANKCALKFGFLKASFPAVSADAH